MHQTHEKRYTIKGTVSGYWVEGGLQVTSAVLCQYLDSGTVQGLTCAIIMADIGTVFPLICPLKLQQI